MQTRWIARALTLGISVGILTAPTVAMAATKTMNGPTSKTPATRDGIKGNWHEYIEYTYQDVAGRVNGLAAGSGLTAGEIQSIINLATQNPNLTDAQLLAEINRIKLDKARQAVMDAFDRKNGQAIDDMTVYRQAGALTFQLAQQLQALGGFPAGDVIFDGQYWYGTAYNWAVSTGVGWPLEAAMIHGPEYAPTGTRVNAAAMLMAWRFVMNGEGPLSDPLVLDLNGNGKVDVTGKSSAKFRAKDNRTFVADGSVVFDLLGTGRPLRTEWVKSGDGILVDNRKNKAFDLVKQGKPLAIANLFGDDGGHFSGFMKLAREFDPNAKVAAASGNPVGLGLGTLKGKTLDDMLVWVDDGDGKATTKELFKLSALGITEIKLPARFVQNEAGEYLEHATFTRKGKEFGIQEVWFATEKDQ